MLIVNDSLTLKLFHKYWELLSVLKIASEFDFLLLVKNCIEKKGKKDVKWQD